MSSSWHSPPDGIYWSTPRQPKSTRTVNFDGNQNVVEISTLSSRSKSVSEPSSPQQWHKVLSVDESEDLQRNLEKCQTISGIGARHKKHSFTRQPNEGTELAELLAEHQGRQLQSMNGLDTGAYRQWGSCSKLNELHLQTSRPQNSTIVNTVRHVEFPVKDELSTFGASEYLIISQASAQNPSAVSAPISHVQEGSVVRASPLTVIGDGYVNASGRASQSISPSTDDGDKWASLVRAKDDLIGQKDQIIERQKQSMFELQQQVLQMSTPHPHVSRTVSVDSDANMVLKLQEFHYQNAQLRAHLADKDSSIDRLQKKLGETEYLLENMKASVKDSTASNKQELERLQQKSVEHDKVVAELTSKTGQLEEEKLKLKREKQSLERYLGDVPTVEEHQKTLKTLREVREECDRLKETISSKDKKLARMNKAFGNKNDEARKLTAENTALKDNVQRLQVSLDKLNCDGPVSVISFEDLKMDNERLHGELERTKKMLESKHKKIKALHYQAQNEQKSLEDRLAQEEDMVTALRGELVDKETSLEEVKKAVKEIASQNQDLLEENLNLQSCCEQLKRTCSKDNMDAGKKLWKELLDCTKELQAVVEVARERKEGKHPEMSVLFGLRSSSVDSEDFDGKELSDDLSAINTKIDGVKRLRSDVSDLRNFICDQYAEDIGNNCRMQ